MSGSYLDLPALELAAAIARGETSCVEVTAEALARIARYGGEVGAFVHVDGDGASRRAVEVDARVAAGERAPLLGVPCPIKDLSMVAGLPFEAGSAALAGHVAPVDDGVTISLRGAGTVCLGKTATPEFGFPCYTEPDVAPPARTPWDLSRSAGGSSGGAAAAVAAGLVPIAHGSDGGGSIRIPASACGLVGLKPSRGLVSPGPIGVDGPGLASHCVLTRTVRDTAAGLDVLAAPWPGDVYALAGPQTSYVDACDRPPPPLRIGVLTTPVIAAADVHPAPLRALERAEKLLRGLGHDVAAAPVPFPAERWQAFSAVWSVAALSIPLPEGTEGRLVPLTRWLRGLGRAVTGAEYAQALAETQHLARETAEAWAGFDVILTPTLAQPPALIGSLRDDADPAGDFDAQCRYTPWTSIANLTGRPSISLPLHSERLPAAGSWQVPGRSDHPSHDRSRAPSPTELPFGVMLTARLGDDELLLGLSAQLEAADPWASRRPVGYP